MSVAAVNVVDFKSARKSSAKAKAKKAQPERPVDPHLALVLEEIKGIAAAKVSRLSGNFVGAATIASWRRKGTIRPQHYTMMAALRAVGKEFAIRRIRQA